MIRSYDSFVCFLEDTVASISIHTVGTSDVLGHWIHRDCLYSAHLW